MKTIQKMERRRVLRTVVKNIYIDIYSQTEPDRVEVIGKIYDISPLGAKFISHRPYIIGSKIHLNILSTNHIPPIDISGRVVHCEQKDNDEFYTAVEFKEDYK